MAAGELETEQGYGLDWSNRKMLRDCGAFVFSSEERG
jgi:hypothetical protein